METRGAWAPVSVLGISQRTRGAWTTPSPTYLWVPHAAEPKIDLGHVIHDPNSLGFCQHQDLIFL